MKKFLSWKVITILIATLLLGYYDLPESISGNKVNLGLDLQGGSQLDYKIVLPELDEASSEQLVEGVQNVIQRRVNALGIAEPNIYRSEIAGETHIVVELAETGTITQEDIDLYLGESKTPEELTDDQRKLVSLEKAKATVGKTIQLEFKEEKTTLDPAEADKIRSDAEATLARVNDSDNFSIVGQEAEQASPGKVTFEKSNYVFESKLPASLKEILPKLEIGAHHNAVIELGGNYVIGSDGALVEQSTLDIVRLVDKKEETKYEKQLDTSRIIVRWSGSEGSDASISRDQDSAYERAKEALEKINSGASFDEVAGEYSDLEEIKFTVNDDSALDSDILDQIMSLEEGTNSEILQSEEGYQIYHVNSLATDIKEVQYQYESISYSTAPDPWQETGLDGKHFVRADVQVDNLFQPYVQIQFDEEGAKLFEEVTARNVNKPLAIFVGGDLITNPPPTVQSVISGGTAQITGRFTQEEAQALARDLNTGAIPAPIILTGEYTIGATLGHAALSQSIYAGAIGLILVVIFMLAYYRLPGLVASGALLVYGVILLFLIKSEIHLGISLAMAILVFGFIITRIINSEDSGWEKLLSFCLACAGFFFVTFLLKTPVILTLAGFAGLILSVGMAVDANILIFERLKEEISKGKNLNTAINTAFRRAWTAIRDSNFSTLFTCAILFYFGSSIIRGFAFNLAAGVLVSMFTAITVTRILIEAVARTETGKNYIIAKYQNKGESKTRKFLKNTKAYFATSATLVTLSVIAIATFGLNLGIDFTGGSLMELKFEEKVEKTTIEEALVQVENQLNENVQVADDQIQTNEETQLSPSTPALVDLRTAQVLASDENSYIIKTKYLSSETHDEIIDQLQDILPAFTEPRFTTIGPTIGSTLLGKAVKAIGVALLLIVLYVAFAFRRVPKSVSPWRFGAVAIAALVHDVLIVTGIFAVIGQVSGVEIDALFITAMLTVFGYSVNDTIVVLDRLRENLIRKSDENLSAIADQSLSETLARSINTSLSTAIALIAILIFGSNSIFYFVLALTIGIVIGTYSSIFIATPLLVKWSENKNK